MAISTMYPAKNNSPKTQLAAQISASDITMTLLDASVLPEAPNLAVLGSGDDAEIISYSEIEGNVVKGIVRGINGTVQSVWPAGTVVARNSTSYDHDIFITNIKDLDTRKANAEDLGLLAALDTVDLTSNVTGVLSIANGGLGTSDDTGWLPFTNSEVFSGTLLYRKMGNFFQIKNRQWIKPLTAIKAKNGLTLGNLSTVGVVPKTTIGQVLINASLDSKICLLKIENGAIRIQANGEEIPAETQLLITAFTMDF